LHESRSDVTRRGAVTVPAELRRRDNIKAGEMFVVERIDHGEYLLRRRPAPRNEGLIGNRIPATLRLV